MLERFGSDRWLAAFLLVACLLTLVALGAQRHLSSFADALERRHVLHGRIDSLVRLRHALAENEIARTRLATGAGPEAHTQREHAHMQVFERLRQLQASYAGTIDPPEALSRIQSAVTRELARSASVQQAVASPGASAAAVAAYRARRARLDADLADLAHTQQAELESSVRATHMQTREFVQRVTWVTGAGVLLVLALGALHARGARMRVRAHDRAAKVQRTLEHRLDSLLDHMTDGFVALDRDLRLLSVNDRACVLLRSPREELIGRPVWSRFPDDAQAALRRACERCTQDGQARHLEIHHEPWQSWFQVDIYPSLEGLTCFFGDITQRKLAERTLRQSKAQQELARWEVGVWEWDLRRDEVYLSREWKSQLGHADHEIDNGFVEWERRLHPDDREEVMRRLRAAAYHAAPGERFELEYRLRHKDGGYRWILSRGMLRSDASGAPTVLCGVHLDITDRKRAEQERSTVQRRLKHIISSIRDGFVTLDRDWNYTYANDAAAQLLGRSREDLIGHNVWALFPETRYLPFHDACVRCMQQREPVQLDQYYAPHYRWYRNHFYPTDDGIAIFFEDFTARKRLEAQLADERERYRATFEQPAIGILHVALEGTITRCNERMAEMLGYERLDLVGQDFARILAEPQPGLFLEDVQDPARGRARRLVQCRFQRRDGECFWGEMTLAFVPGEEERSGYVVCMVHDISDRKRAEALLEESRRRLDAFAQQLTEAIEQERARISREIHDELGQALTRLKMDLGWMRRRLGESGQTSGPVATRVVEMGRFIDETLVSVRRLATELRPALLDNLGLAAALNAQMRQLGAQADIEVTQHLESDLPLTSEQATGLYRIAQEAVTNIVRHAGARNVRCVLFLDDDGVTMEIQDDGCGFDLSLPHQRGLGLVGIAERARLLGGLAAVESEAGRGTLVRVHLPTATAGRAKMAG